MSRSHRVLIFVPIVFFLAAYLHHLDFDVKLLSSTSRDEEKHLSPNNDSFIHTTEPQENASQYRISFRFHSPDVIGVPSQFLSVPGYKCPIEIASLPPLVNNSAIFNFTTTISTDLKVLFIGDSIMQQLAQNVYSSVLLHDNVSYKPNDFSWGGKDGRHVVLRSFINGIHPEMSGLHVCSSISAPVHGGGAVAYYRLLDLPTKEGEKDYFYCKNDKGWSMTDVRGLLDFEVHQYDGKARPLVHANSSHDSGATTFYKSQDADPANVSGVQVGKFNAIILRPPGPGWMKLREITRERILESIQLLHELFGVETIILTTLMFNNNVLSLNDWKDLLRINDMIRDISHNWDINKSGVKFVLVQDLGTFTNEILWMNARHLGYNVSYDPVLAYDRADTEWENGSKFLLHRLIMKNWKFNPSIPMVCNTPPICIPQVHELPNGTIFKQDDVCDMNITADPFQCFFNRFSRDGMHWCMETIGPRYSASVACLLGCVYNGDVMAEYTEALDDESTTMMEHIRQCEMECNRRYMSLSPVENSFLADGTFIYSKSKPK